MMHGFTESLTNWFTNQGVGDLIDTSVQAGGSINRATIIRFGSGERYFLKQNQHAPESMFASEAQSLQLITARAAFPVPKPCYWDAQCLLMEVIDPAPKQKDYWEIFGRQLAAMHRVTQANFGLDFQTYCGTTLQNNQPQQDGYAFFADQRLLPLGQQANAKGLLQAADMAAIESLCRRLTGLIPFQPASLIHGDLWSGNAHTDSGGYPVLIDPALYFGWREAELGMTQLFGGFPSAFYAAYQEAWPLEPGWEERLAIYNLYHLLNHLNLFGSGYLQQTRQVLSRFS